MSKKSAGILLFRRQQDGLEVLLAHPGGPFWSGKDRGAWSIPKGEFPEDEDPLDAARREFKEETGTGISGDFIPLSPIKQKSGKMIYAWALQSDLDTGKIRSNEFEIEWPPKSGRKMSFPEIDRAQWFSILEAKRKIHPGQLGFLDELAERL